MRLSSKFDIISMSTYPRQEKQGFFNGPPLLCVLRFSQEVPPPPVPKTHLSAVLVIGRACDGKKKVTESIHKIAVGCKYRFHRQCGWLGWQSFSFASLVFFAISRKTKKMVKLIGKKRKETQSVLPASANSFDKIYPVIILTNFVSLFQQ